MRQADSPVTVRLALLAFGAVLLGGCAGGLAGSPRAKGTTARAVRTTLPGERRPVLKLPPGTDARRAASSGQRRRPGRAVLVVTDGTQTNREAARALAAPLAAECSAECLGVATGAEECLAAARERGAESLITCRVIEYDPYDPARLTVRVAIERAPGRLHLRAAEAAALGRATHGASGPGPRGAPPGRTVEIDLRSTGSWFASYASACGLGGSPEDLLEAEVLLRDPGRFFPFAAKHIAEEALTAETPSPGPASVPSPRPVRSALGVLDGLR